MTSGYKNIPPQCGATLIVCPAFNEERTIGAVLRSALATLDHVSLQASAHLLVLDDGSTDSTAQIARSFAIPTLSHPKNRGYGSALISGFAYAIEHNYGQVITMDVDGQHDPSAIPQFMRCAEGYDIVSGSRYMSGSLRLNSPPNPNINRLFAGLVNEITGYSLSDVACGMKRISVSLLAKLDLFEAGYGFPLEFWLQCAEQGASVSESPIPMIYPDPSRNLALKFSSVEAGVDYGMFVILRALLRVRAHLGYRSDYGTVLAGIVPSPEPHTRRLVEHMREYLLNAPGGDVLGRLTLLQLKNLIDFWNPIGGSEYEKYDG